MVKTCPTSLAATHNSSSSSSRSNIGTTTSSSNLDRRSAGGNTVPIHDALSQLNKSSYVISKPVPEQTSGGGGGDTGNSGHHKPQPPPPPPPAAPPLTSSQPPPPQPPPPVYNINRSDFRDVVQKLTGTPVHHPRVPSPQVVRAPPQPPKPVLFPGGGGGGGAFSRLQKIRPPPLAQLTPRPQPTLAPAAATDVLLPQAPADGYAGGAAWATPLPLSPLPPLPTVSAAVESPITAYMRCLRSCSSPVVP